MILKKKHIKPLLLVLIISLSPSCSTKKKAWVNRQYHNTTAKYNGYFNGNQSIKNGVKKLHANHTDDYTEIIPVFPTGDLTKAQNTNSYMDKAIQKGSVVIQRHSMKIKNKEYCRWIDDNYLMVGKAYFYKGDFKEAIKTFNFIKNEYSMNEIRFDAALWLIRAHVEAQDFLSAESELLVLINNKKLPKKIEQELSIVAADLYVQKKELLNATKHLLRATAIIKKKRKKVRMNYILAQIYQYSNNYTLAQKHYEIVLKSNPEYEMAFNAKMNLARSLSSGSPGTKKMKSKLLKMTKDDKNIEYLDQIYYTIAEMDINNEDTLSAIENYTLSTVNSVENNSQKALSFLSLGKIYFKKSEYNKAKLNYDSTVFYMQKDFRLFEETAERHRFLTDLITNINIVEKQDSLQVLANLPEVEKRVVIQKIIQQEIDKERKMQEDQRLRQQMMYESGRNGRSGERFGSKTSGGKWYFYNPATLSFGMSEFRKKWGKRKLEDDWRRKDKQRALEFESDSARFDTASNTLKNTKDPNYYLNQLPKSKEDFERSNTLIKESLYQIGLIYRESLNELDLSTEAFFAIFNRFPSDKQYAPLGLYNAHINYTELNSKKAISTKEDLLQKYPNSAYAKMLENPNYISEIMTEKDLAELSYKAVLDRYKEGGLEEVIKKTENLEDDQNKNRLLLLRGLAFIKAQDLNKAQATLNNVTEIDAKVYEEARYILAAIKDPSKINKANEIAVSGTSYLYRPNNPHMIILVLPKTGVDIAYLKIRISDFHSTNIANEIFEISGLLMGADRHVLMIKSFSGIKESMVYYRKFLEEKSLKELLAKSEHRLMSISIDNFKEFYKNKDVDGYFKFFSNKYLTIN